VLQGVGKSITVERGSLRGEDNEALHHGSFYVCVYHAEARLGGGVFRHTGAISVETIVLNPVNTDMHGQGSSRFWGRGQVEGELHEKVPIACAKNFLANTIAHSLFYTKDTHRTK